MLADHFLDAERRGRPAHGLSRIDWLATLPGLDPRARPERLVAEEGYELWDGGGALGYLTLAAIVEAQLASPPAHARVVAARECFPTGSLGYWVRRLAEGGLVGGADGDVAGAARPPRGRPAARGHEPAGDRGPELGRASRSSWTSRWARSRTATSSSARHAPEDLVPFGGEQAHKALRARRRPPAPGGRTRGAGEGHGAVLVVARPEADPVPALRARAGDLRLPGDR